MSETTILEKGHGSVRLADAVIRSSIGKFASTFRRNRQRRELALINCAIKFFEAGNQIVYLGIGNEGKPNAQTERMENHRRVKHPAFVSTQNSGASAH